MKEWKNAEIVELDISETELNNLEGTIVDDQYQDCDGEWWDAYS